VDDLRKETAKRKKQVSAAAKRARERAKTADEEYWGRRRRLGDKHVRPGRIRLGEKTVRPTRRGARD
jgi:hypothetical protein